METNMRGMSLVLTVCLLASSALAAPAPKAFVCAFEGATVTTVDNGEIKKAASTDKMTLTYAAIDMAAGKAQLVGNIGAGEVAVIAAEFGYSFVEITAVGAVNLTTVFSTTLKRGGFFAIHSRHVNIAGPLVSQFAGSCEARN